MKRLTMIIALLAIYISPTYAETVVLNADMVTSASDIENAIATATKSGSEPGHVILDGSHGDFDLSGDDKSINLIFSKVVLEGKNDAKIINCDDGLVFDPFYSLSDISIQRITFECFGNGVTDLSLPNQRENIFLHANTFKALKNGIQIHNAKNWNIIGNNIKAGTSLIPGDTTTVIAIYIGNGINSNITSNKISGYDGIYLEMNSSRNNVINNEICIYNSPGVLLDATTSSNNVIKNEIASQGDVVTVENDGVNNNIVGNYAVKKNCN
ncbi:MAG: hypothetical protein ACXV8O_05855 [Methylobacter sp.]